MKVFAVLTAWALWVLPLLSLAEGVRYRGIFVNDEDWGLRPWAVRHFGAEEQIGTNAYAEIFALMKANGLNLIWPAMHEGGYEFSARPENLELARHWGITVGTSHCEPMLRNNCYLAKADKKKWSWVSNRDFLEDYWREGVRRGMGNGERGTYPPSEASRRRRCPSRGGNGDVLWTIGMRGIHDGRMPDGKTTEEKIKILEEVFAAQCAMLPEGAPKLFCPYKEVLPIFNAGLKVPEDATILWVNDNFGYVRRIGGDHGIHGTHGRQGIYWHLSYWGSPHGYIHLCTTPPAFMWYELVAKCWENGVRDVWMVNAGDVFQAEILLDAFGKFAADPESWGPDAQVRFLSSWATTFLSSRVGKSDVGCPKSDVLAKRIAAHLAEYYNLGFNRKPEHMCVQWSRNLPESVKASLLKRYHALLNEDMAIERLLHDSTRSTRLKIADEYFRLVGFQARFLAYAGIIHLEGRDKAYARAVLDPLYARWDALDGGKWSGFWIDTIEEKPGKHQPTAHNRWSSQMQWPWNEPDDPARKDCRGEIRNDYVATAYAWERAKGLEEPTWLEPVARESGAKGGEWVNVAGLGTSGNALALLPVKPGVGDGAVVKYSLTGFTRLTGLGANENSNLQLESPTLNHVNSVNPVEKRTIVLQFLPDFALWPGLKLGVKVSFDDGEAKYVEVPRSDSNIGEKDSVRAVAVQDNFIRVDVPIPSGAKTATITAVDPGVVIDRVGVRPAVLAAAVVHGAERPVEVRVRQTPGGPRIFVDGRAVRPRFYYGSSPCLAPISNTGRNVYTIPFRPDVDTDQGRIAIDGFADDEPIWFSNAALIDKTTNATVRLSSDGEERTRHFVRDGLHLRKGHLYHFVVTHRSTHQRTYFTHEASYTDAAGRKVVMPLPYGDTLGDTVRLAADAQVDFVTFSTGTSWGSAGGWWAPPEEPPDYGRIDRACEHIIAANPNALLVPRVNADAPGWMLERDPSLKMVFDRGYSIRMSSVSARPYREAACAAIEKLTRHLREKFPRNFAGLHVGGQNSAEWFYMNSQTSELSGYDVHTRDAFRAWLAKRDEKDAATAEVPSPEARRVKRPQGRLDPVLDRRVIQFGEFRQEEMASLLCDLGAAVRRGSDGGSLAIFFYGYTWELGSVVAGAAETGHFFVDWIMRHGKDSIDGFSAPFSYSDRGWPGSSPVMSPAETFMRNGFLWINEDDFRTHLEDLWGFPAIVGRQIRNTSPSITRNALLRNGAFDILRGHGDWWMDLFGRGWFRDAEIWKVRKALNVMDDAMLLRKKPYSPEIALVVDERSLMRNGFGSDKEVTPQLHHARFSLNLCGATHGQYLLDDVLANPPDCKLLLIAYARDLDPARRARLEEVKRAHPTMRVVEAATPYDVVTEKIVEHAKAAGVHFYTQPLKATVCAAEGYVVVQAREAGLLEIDFGNEDLVVDFLTGKQIGVGPKVSLSFQKGETRIFRLANR